jgi:hypothetical protein
MERPDDGPATRRPTLFGAATGNAEAPKSGVTVAFRQPTISPMIETTVPENADSIWKSPP